MSRGVYHLIVRGQLRFQARQLPAGRLDIGFDRETVHIAIAGQIDDVALRRNELERDLLQSLPGAQLKISLRNFRFERHQQIVAGFDGAGTARIRRFDRAAHLAEQIDLP